jgi:hypothetical protein
MRAVLSNPQGNFEMLLGGNEPHRFTVVYDKLGLVCFEMNIDGYRDSTNFVQTKPAI